MEGLAGRVKPMAVLNTTTRGREVRMQRKIDRAEAKERRRRMIRQAAWTGGEHALYKSQSAAGET
jgi:hypothetical protein